MKSSQELSVTQENALFCSQFQSILKETLSWEHLKYTPAIIENYKGEELLK
jgi:hypothetical protein